MQLLDQRVELGLVAQRQVDAEFDDVLGGRGGHRLLHLCRQRGLAREKADGAKRRSRHLVDSHGISSLWESVAGIVPADNRKSLGAEDRTVNEASAVKFGECYPDAG